MGQPPDSASQPHHYPICWTPERVRTVFTTESRQKARDLFLQTHRPFRHIRVDVCKAGHAGQTFVTEEAVRAIIQAGPLDADNRLFFVVGEAGSGKSELCQWLEYTVDPHQRLPIHIPRSMTSAAHVVALLRQALNQPGSAAALPHVPLPLQADYIALSAVVLLYEQGRAPLMPLPHWEALLTSTALKTAIQEHLAAASAGQWDHELLATPASFHALCTQAGVAPDLEDAPDTWPAIRHLLHQALEQTLWFGDLRALLGHLATVALAQGRRPLLLLEDVTAFRVLGDRLLDYLLDLTSGHFDAVIGVTTGFEQTQLARATLAGDLTHIHHRLQARFVLTDDHGRSYGLEDDVVELARAYLRAVKPDCPTCPLQANCQAVFGADLYPFTATALQRACAHLQEEGNPRQTPRLLIEHVLAATLLAHHLPPQTLDHSPYLVTPPTLVRRDAVPDPRLQSMLRWYGEATATHVTLDRALATFWQLPIAPQLVQGDQIQVPRAYVATAPDSPALPTDWQQDLRELHHWLDGGGPYPSRETLKRGIERVLLMLGDPRALGNPHALSLAKAEIVYARGDERIPIFLGRGSGDQPPTRTALKVPITGTPEERGILEELAYLALSGRDLAQVSHNLALTLAWAQRHWETYQADIRALLGDHLGGLPIEHVVLMAWQMLTALYNIPSDGSLSLPCLEDPAAVYATRTPWTRTHHGRCYQAGEALAQWYDAVRRLCLGMFTLRDTLLDQHRYQAARATYDPATSMHTLAVLPLQPLRKAPFHIRPGGQKLYDLLMPLQRYAQALTQLDSAAALQADAANLAHKAAHLVNQQDMDIAVLRDALTALPGRCGTVGVVWRETWDTDLATLHALTPITLHDLQAQVVALQDTINTSPTPSWDVWQYQYFRQTARPVLEHPYWAAIATLHTIQQELRRVARTRYRSTRRVLTGTKAYQRLLETMRTIRQELHDDA